MKIYNTASKKIEELPKADTLSVYSCGPTVYDKSTIGNWRSFLTYDFLVKALRLNGQKVLWGMNYTDVGHLTSDADTGEDKIAKRAKKERKTAGEVALENIALFEKDMQKLNIAIPDRVFKATEFVPQMKKMIEQLNKKGFTYQTDDGIYFDTAKFTHYGELSSLDLQGIKEGARVEKNEQKRNASDFALWKFSPADEKRDMEWSNPLQIPGKGFPGWHIECSVMALKLTGGATVNLHLGGIDLMSTHHQNELAQSEGATGKKFVDIWMHIEHLLIDGKKMGKSEGNAYTLEDLEQRGFSPLDFRYLVCQTHYSQKQNFSWEALEGAKKARNKIKVLMSGGWTSEQNTEPNEAVVGVIKKAVAQNLDMPKALALLQEFLNHEKSRDIKYATVEYLNKDLFGFLGDDDLVNEEIPAQILSYVNEREEARQKKDFVKADELRQKVANMGYIIEDTKKGPQVTAK